MKIPVSACLPGYSDKVIFMVIPFPESEDHLPIGGVWQLYSVCNHTL